MRVQSHGLPGLYYGGMAAADFDGDGRQDLVMAGAWDRAFSRPDMSGFAFADRVRLYQNVSSGPGDIRFSLQQELDGVRGGGGALVKTGDFDGDGRVDFAVQFRDGDAPQSDTSAFLNRGDWRFERSPLQPGFDTQNNSLGMDAADIDQDGRDDLVFINTGYNTGEGLWYKFTGDRWLPQQSDFTHEISYGGTISAGDLDGDGYPEIVVGGNGSAPFGNYDCTGTLLYGQVHRNAGAMMPGLQREAFAVLGHYALSASPNNPPRCEGMDNASVLVADVDLDGQNDVLIAGSMSNFSGPQDSDWTHYDFAVLYNRDGSGRSFTTFENGGPRFPGGVGATNGGAGNIDFPNIALGDLDGDGFPEALIQGHHKDYSDGVGGAYRFDTRLYRNLGDRFEQMDVDLRQLAECGGVLVDFDNDGKRDVVYCGARPALSYKRLQRLRQQRRQHHLHRGAPKRTLGHFFEAYVEPREEGFGGPLHSGVGAAIHSAQRAAQQRPGRALERPQLAGHPPGERVQLVILPANKAKLGRRSDDLSKGHAALGVRIETSVCADLGSQVGHPVEHPGTAVHLSGPGRVGGPRHDQAAPRFEQPHHLSNIGTAIVLDVLQARAGQNEVKALVVEGQVQGVAQEAQIDLVCDIVGLRPELRERLCAKVWLHPHHKGPQLKSYRCGASPGTTTKVKQPMIRARAMAPDQRNQVLPVDIYRLELKVEEPLDRVL